MLQTANPKSTEQIRDRLNFDQLKLERRRVPRRAAEHSVTAIFRDQEERRGVLPLSLIDSSATGVGGRSPRELTPGTRLSFCSPVIPVPARHGTVVRCTPDDAGHGFLIGVRLDSCIAGTAA